jgi:hypothetical protein
MTEGIRSFRVAQLGLESTKGTAVAATVLWRGLGTFQDGTVRNYPEESLGYFVKVDRHYEAMTVARMTMESTPFTFEQAPYLFASCIKNVVAGAADGAGSGKIYTYPFSTTTLNTVKTYTLEAGDNIQGWEAAYGFCRSFEISGSGGQDSDAVMISAEWIAREWAKTTLSSPSLVAVEEASFLKSKLYIDAVGGTMGSTQKTAMFVGFTFRADPGIREMFTGDGNLYFTDALLRKQPEITCDIEMLYTTDAIAQIDNWLAGTPVLIEIALEGTALTGAGTTYTYKTLRLQMPGSWKEFSGLEDVEEGDKITGTFIPAYDTTAGIGPSIVVVNEVTTLP